MDTLKIKPSQERELAVKVDNSEAFAGFELKIFLPDGISFQGTTKAKRVKASDRLEGFNISGANQTDGSYKISVANFDGELIQPGEGALFNILLKADENATLGTGEIKLGTVRYSKDEVLYTVGDVSSNITIFDIFTITASSANSEMGSVTGGGDYESGTNATLTATANEGYHFVKWSNDVTDNPYTFEVTTNASLTATFAPNQYAMTFILGNGEANVVKTQDYGSALTAPTGFERSGYSFTGWSPEVPTTIPLGNQTYTAQWNVVDYTISYDLAGGQLAEGVTNPTSYNIESEDITLANPTREGYTFAGWTGTGLTEATQTVTIAKGSTGNRSYTATWIINQYTMKFVLGNGDDDIDITQDYGSELTAPTGFERLGYSFTGWSPEVPTTIPLGNQTYTAQWNVVDYTISYDLAGGQLAEGVTNPTSYNIESEDITLANPTREGYTFAGWTGTGLTEATQTVTIAKGSTGNRSYTATWIINQYAMTFVLDNGETDIVKTQDYGSELTAPDNVQKTGYTFMGWSPEVPETVPSSNQTFTAQWQINQYKMTFVFGEGYENVEKIQNYNTELTAPTVPERVGYTFAGWNPEVNTTVPAEDKTFTAQWNLNKYKVTFKDYDGSILLAETEYDYDSDLSGVVPNMTGRTNNDGAPFGGWDNDYTGKVPAHDVVYTAVYGGTYILQFVVDGEIIQSGEVEYNTAITAPESPTKEEHTFMGWKDQYDKYFNEYNGKMPAKNVTFTAQWKANQYTVTFVLNNGSTDIVYTQDYGSPIVAPEDPVKKGHTFTGWTPEVASVVPGHNLTYEATYQVNTYNVIYMVYGEEWARDQYTYDSPIVIRQYSGTILDDFRGWQSDVEYTNMPDHDVTYVADITRLDPIAITSAMIQDIADTTYVGSAIEPAIVVKYGELTLVEGTDYSVNYADNINAGTAKATVTAIQGSCFTGSADKMFTILKADVTVTKAPVGLNLVYTGQPLALVDAGIVEGGTILYSEDGETYSENIPTGTEVQDYTVYYKIIGDANHNDKGVQTLNASIFRGFPVVVAAGEYVTFYCDRALKLDVAETDAKLYTVTDVNGFVATVSELTVAAANTPLLVYNKGVETKTFILVPTDDAPDNIAVYSGFKGSLEDQQMDGSSDTKDYYVMTGQCFMLVRDAGTIAANRCWIEINKSVSLSAPRLIIGGGGPGTTGINGIINTADDNEAWYDLNGRKLASKPTQKGLYIKNGKKVVIK